MAIIEDVDVVVVGAGFGGVWMTHELKAAGFQVACLEKGPKAGGVWHWNCYPGARVDSRYPIYQLTAKELYQDWTWSELFPGYDEIRRYFDHVVEKWNLVDNIRYNTEVRSASFNEADHKWSIVSVTGDVIRARWYIPALGFASKPYIPSFKRLDTFRGAQFHSSQWPQQGVDLKGKRVAVVGTGASAVQIIQTIASEVDQLTVYQRTPCVCLPMRQQNIDKAYQDQLKESGEIERVMHRSKYEKFGGQDVQFVSRAWADDTPEQHRAVFEEAWQKGGFHPLLSTYFDTFINEEVNHAAWRFWAEKCQERIKRPEYKEILAPLNAVHAFGGKRTPFEQTYYEAFNLAHVDLIDTKASPIQEFTEAGIVSQNEGLKEFDIIVHATGFDTNTGGLTAIETRDTSGQTMAARWAEGVYTNYGICTSKFPNMFFLYGPQAPTAFANGPSCVELQGEFISQLIIDMTSAGITRVETTQAAENKWRKSTHEIWSKFVFSSTKGSWYCGANIPGKKQEPLNWFGGFPAYHKAMTASKESGYSDFITSSLIGTCPIAKDVKSNSFVCDSASQSYDTASAI